MNKKALLISYYWPPAGGSGVQRWVKMAKYFKENSWDITVLIPTNPAYPITDQSFVEEVQDIPVITCPIFEPSRFLKKAGAKNTANLSAGFVQTKKNSFAEIAIAIRGNLFIPDARMLWIKPAVKKLKEYLTQFPVDVIISTGPPHSCHLIALAVSKKFNLKWVADFRDPWTNIDFYKDLHLTKWADKHHKQLEKKVLQQADLITVVGSAMQNEFLNKGAKQVEIIPNGYDYNYPNTQVQQKKFTLSHIGTLGKNRNPIILWKCLGEICAENPQFKQDFCLQLIGLVDENILHELKKNHLDNQVALIPNVPHEKAIEHQKNTSVLLLIINNTPNATGILTGKLFEYLSVKRPILGIGPSKSDASEILSNTQAGKMIDYMDEKIIKQHLLHLYQSYKNNTLELNATNIDQYSRKNLSKQFCSFLNQLTK